MRIFASITLAATLVAAAAADTFKAGSLTFEKPAAFTAKQLPPGGMRAAQLEFAKDGKAAEIIFFHFGAGQGGGTQANIDRWLAMFQEGKDKIGAKTEKKKAGKGEVHYVEAEGTFMSGMPGGQRTPQPGTRLIGAIIEDAGGNIYVRMTGPAAVVKAADADFRKMVESALK